MKIILLIILFFIGCHPPKKFIYKYKSSPKNWFRFNMGEKYGPKIGKLSNNTFWIDYNFVTDLEFDNFEKEYYLLRCAELTKEMGFKFFIILIENVDQFGNTSGQMIIQCFKKIPPNEEISDLAIIRNADIIIENNQYLYNGKKAYKKRHLTKIKGIKK